MSFDRAQAERLAEEAADAVKEAARRFATGLEELIEQAALEVDKDLASHRSVHCF